MGTVSGLATVGTVTGTSARIRALIRRKGLTQQVLASSIGLHETKLSKSLSGTRNFTDEELTCIANACGVTVTYLTDGVPAQTGDIDVPQQAGSRREQILDATVRTIARRGFHSVRMADIANICETSRTTVHYYFPNRIALLNEALRWCTEQLFRRIQANIQATEDPEEQLHCLIEMQLPTEDRVRDEWSVWIQFWAEVCHRPELREAHREIYRRWQRLLADVLEALAHQGKVESEDPKRAAVRLAFIIDGATTHWLTGAADFDLDTLRTLLLTEAGIPPNTGVDRGT